MTPIVFAEIFPLFSKTEVLLLILLSELEIVVVASGGGAVGVRGAIEGREEMFSFDCQTDRATYRIVWDVAKTTLRSSEKLAVYALP